MDDATARYVAALEAACVCLECGASLLSDHHLDCGFWGEGGEGRHEPRVTRREMLDALRLCIRAFGAMPMDDNNVHRPEYEAYSAAKAIVDKADSVSA